MKAPVGVFRGVSMLLLGRSMTVCSIKRNDCSIKRNALSLLRKRCSQFSSHELVELLHATILNLNTHDIHSTKIW